MSFDKYGYVSEETLKEIEYFDILPDLKNVPKYLDLIESHWKYSDFGFIYHPETGCLELHTAGWSGNENIIHAMKNTLMFWTLFWYKSKRGGHYWFELFMFDENGQKCLPRWKNNG